MLVRAYRFTDKLGVVILKSSVALVDVTLDGLLILVHRLLAPILRLIGMILRPIGLILAGLLLLIVNLFRRATGQTALSAERMMARRAARAQMEAAITEDPLRAQNRMLSTLTVLLLAALIGVVLWATNPTRLGSSSAGGAEPLANVSLFAATSVQQETGPTAGPLATPVPTATPLPSLLEVRGSLAYTVRESGQTDIWAVPVGSQTPLRLTNSPEDERDPAWSPDGRRLAYASRQDGNWDLYVYDLTSGDTTRMTYDLSFQGGPAWDPAGEWLVFETYQGGNLDIQFLRVDGSQSPMMPVNSPEPDFSPAWSPDGRQIAFVSWREGNQDIYIFDLDDQTVTNLTNTPTRFEDYPSWSPNGDLITYSALENGMETVFVKSVSDLDSPAQPQYGGRNPSWSPDGTSIVFTADVADGGQLIAGPFSGAGVVTAVIRVPAGSTGAVWTRTPLPQPLVNSGGLPAAITTPLYIEEVSEQNLDPPFVLHPIGVTAESANLSDRVDDSFRAMREAVLNVAGWDVLGRLDHVFWSLERPPELGVERRNWLMTGRAFAVTRGSIAGSPAALEVVREDVGVDTYWRLYVRVVQDAQDGQLGEPLRRMPWDFASRTEGDVEAYDQGGRLRTQMPQGYYIDLTQIALDYGWQRVPAGTDWRANSNAINFWLFRKTDGLSWYDAMREIYTAGPLINFAPTPTGVPNFETVGSATPPTAPPPQEVEATATVPAAVPTLPPEVEDILTPEGEGQ